MTDQTSVAIGISYQVALGEGRQIVMQTHVPIDADKAEQNAAMDRLRELSDRQVAFAKIEKHRTEIEDNQSQKTRLLANLDMVDQRAALTRRHAAHGDAQSHVMRKLSKEEETARANAVTQVKWYDNVIAEANAKIAELRSTVG